MSQGRDWSATQTTRRPAWCSAATASRSRPSSSAETSASRPRPASAAAVALRVVESGELLPASAVGSADALALRPVAVPVTGRLPEAVRGGARVDLWFSPKARAADDAPAAPSQLAAALIVAEVDRPQGAFAAGGATTVHVLVPVEQLPDVLAALAANGRVDVVAVPGS